MSRLEEQHGFRELSSPLTETMLAPLATQVNRLQIGAPLADSEYVQVAGLLERHPHVGLRVYDGSIKSPFTDLKFLRYFPRLRHVSLDLFGVQDFDGLHYLADDIETLSLGQFKTKRFSLHLISRFSQLKTLYLTGPAKDIEAISSLTVLQTLGLTSFRLVNLGFLLPLRELTSLSVTLGSLDDGSQLPRVGKLAHLSIRRVRGVEELEWLSEMEKLESLWLQDLPHVEKLPNLARLEKLERAILEGLRGLVDVTGMAHAKSLRQLHLLNMPALTPESVVCFRDHSVCSGIVVGLGSDERNRHAYAALGRSHERAERARI